MAHRIIISSLTTSGPAEASAAESVSFLEYEVSFTPSHDLPENVVDKRIAKARRVLTKLAADMIAPIGSTADD